MYGCSVLVQVPVRIQAQAQVQVQVQVRAQMVCVVYLMAPHLYASSSSISPIDSLSK